MQLINERIESFAKQISTYDKANWEIIIENYKSKSNSLDFSSKSQKNIHRQFIDIDLFRGKPFQKAKPSYQLRAITFKAFFRILFYPLYSKWWINHLQFYSYLLFLCVYFVEVITLSIYFISKNVNENLTFFEANSCILMTFIVGEMYNHVIAKNLTKPLLSSTRGSKESSPPITWSHSSESLKLSTPSLFREAEDEVVRNRIQHKKKHNEKRIDSDNSAQISQHKKLFKKNPIETEDDLNKERFLIENDANDNGSGSDVSQSSFSLADAGNIEEPFPTATNIPISDYKNIAINDRGHVQEDVMVTFFETGGVRKVKMSIWRIVEMIQSRVNSTIVKFKYFYLFLFVCIFYAFVPYLFEVFEMFKSLQKEDGCSSVNGAYLPIFWFKANSTILVFEIIMIMVVRFIMTGCCLFLLFVAEKTFRLRSLHAKYFGALTSSRRAKRCQLPHFRLHKVRNIKAWLSLRSYLKRFGPVRSIDIVVSCTFYVSIFLITLVCVTFLINLNDKNSENFLDEYFNWEIPLWSILFSSFLLRFLSLGADVNRKYNNNTELLTEQINLFLLMEVFPQKKDEYIVANNVLKLASKLIKEIESPQKVTGFIMNPLLRNITRVVILSLISGVISEIFGINFKFWKIKAS